MKNIVKSNQLDNSGGGIPNLRAEIMRSRIDKQIADKTAMVKENNDPIISKHLPILKELGWTMMHLAARRDHDNNPNTDSNAIRLRSLNKISELLDDAKLATSDVKPQVHYMFIEEPFWKAVDNEVYATLRNKGQEPQADGPIAEAPCDGPPVTLCLINGNVAITRMADPERQGVYYQAAYVGI